MGCDGCVDSRFRGNDGRRGEAVGMTQGEGARMMEGEGAGTTSEEEAGMMGAGMMIES